MTPKERAIAVVNEMPQWEMGREFLISIVEDAIADAVVTVHEHYFDLRLRLANAEVLLERVIEEEPLSSAGEDEVREFLRNKLP